jgi:hypothetical protein
MRLAWLCALLACNSQPLPGEVASSAVTYTHCASGLYNPDGNVFLNSAGFQDGAVLTLARGGTSLTATWVDQNGLTSAFDFSAAAGTLGRMGDEMSGFSALCVMGPGNETFHPARMTVDAGVLTEDGSAVFVTLTGRLVADAGACGMPSAPASAWIVCRDRSEGALPPAGDGGAASWLAAGRYSCHSQVESYQLAGGIGQYVGSGGSGALTLTREGAGLTADYAGDTSLAGTLRLQPTTAVTARAGGGQTLTTPCTVPIGMAGGPPDTLPVAAASLSAAGSSLFLSFTGTMGATTACSGAQVAGSIICAR